MTDPDPLAKELREAALAIEHAAMRTRCYSVIQPVVTAATDHITALAGNIEKNARIAELEAASARVMVFASV